MARIHVVYAIYDVYSAHHRTAPRRPHVSSMLSVWPCSNIYASENLMTNENKKAHNERVSQGNRGRERDRERKRDLLSHYCHCVRFEICLNRWKLYSTHRAKHRAHHTTPCNARIIMIIMLTTVMAITKRGDNNPMKMIIIAVMISFIFKWQECFWQSEHTVKIRHCYALSF